MPNIAIAKAYTIMATLTIELFIAIDLVTVRYSFKMPNANFIYTGKPLIQFKQKETSRLARMLLLKGS
jgi:hypothetical protein